MRFLVLWLAFLGLGIEAALLIRAWRALAAVRRSPGPDASPPFPGRSEELVAAAIPLALLAVNLIWAQVVRARLFFAYHVDDDSERLRLAVSALEDQVVAFAPNLAYILPSIVLAAATISLLRTARAHARGAAPDLGRTLRVAVLVVGGAVVPVGYAVSHYTAMLSRCASGVAGVDPAMKIEMLERGFAGARAFLGHALLVAAVAGALVTTMLAAMVWRRTTTSIRAGSTPTSPRSWPAIALVAAALLAGAGLRLHRANATPWPAPSRNAVFNVLHFEPSLGEGPDQAPFAPVLEVRSIGSVVDGGRASGETTDRDALESLVVLRNNYGLLHPGEAFPGQISVLCGPNVPASRLDSMLQRAAVLGYLQPSLLFVKPGEIERPVLGRIQRARPTAIEMHVAARNAKGWLPVVGSCADFAAAALAARKRSNYVQPDLHWTQTASDLNPPPRRPSLEETLETVRQHL